MVDRYFLPIPKTRLIGSYIYGKNYKLKAKLHILSAILISFQIGRLTSQRTVTSKPTGYYLDWGSADAPKKIRFY